MNVVGMILERYVSAFGADTYKVQLKNRLTEAGFWVEYTPVQLVRAAGYLRGRNAEGFDVYARPVGYQFVLLDDLRRDILADVATLKPCLLIETSPNNFQTWLALPTTPTDRETAKSICKELAQRFDADLASAEPDHVGRLPGFTNRKEKYRQPNGLFPFVKLHRAECRPALFTPCGGRVLTPIDSPPTETRNPTYTGKASTSEQDFGRACGLVRQGRTDEEIYRYLVDNSPNLSERKGKHIRHYLTRTIQNARELVGRY